jgi:hypothetical protein
LMTCCYKQCWREAVLPSAVRSWRPPGAGSRLQVTPRIFLTVPSYRTAFLVIVSVIMLNLLGKSDMPFSSKSTMDTTSSRRVQRLRGSCMKGLHCRYCSCRSSDGSRRQQEATRQVVGLVCTVVPRAWQSST